MLSSALAIRYYRAMTLVQILFLMLPLSGGSLEGGGFWSIWSSGAFESVAEWIGRCPSE